MQASLHARPHRPLCKPPSRCSARVVTRRCNKQHVPSDSFGGISPEAAAARALRNLFTFISARIVLAQLEGSGRGSQAAYDKRSFDDLSSFLQNERMVDCDEWLAKLMRTNSSLALRLMEVRLAYATDDFEWDQLKRLATTDMSKGNVQIMRKSLTASLTQQAAPDSDAEGHDSAAQQQQQGGEGSGQDTDLGGQARPSL